MTALPFALDIEADLLSIRVLTDWGLGHLARNVPGASTRSAQCLALALQEQATNIVRHAFATSPTDARLTVTFSQDAASLTFVFHDRGEPFRLPSEAPPTASPQFGGLGLPLLVRLTDRHHYERVRGENRWELVFARERFTSD